MSQDQRRQLSVVPYRPPYTDSVGKTRKVLPSVVPRSACLVVLESLGLLLQGLSFPKEHLQSQALLRCPQVWWEGCWKAAPWETGIEGWKNPLQNVRSGWKGSNFEGQKLNLNRITQLLMCHLWLKNCHTFSSVCPEMVLDAKLQHEVNFKAQL